MAHVAGVVDAFREAVEHVEVFRVALPTPGDAGKHGFAGDVLGALEVAEDQVGLGLAARSQGETAVAHDDAGDAVVARARADGIPEHLRIHVRVPVDETGGDHVALRVDGLAGPLGDAPDAGDATVADP